jgi:threonine dehydratase
MYIQQGTIGMEILRQCSRPIDAIFVPVGGGGLVAGVAAFVKRLRPETRIVGVRARARACVCVCIVSQVYIYIYSHYIQFSCPL